MKKIKVLLPLLAVAAFTFTSCEDEVEELTATLKIRNKWTVDSLVYKNTVAGVTTTTKYTGSITDYFDFRSDNLLYMDVNTTPPLKDTVPYSLIGNTKLVTNVNDTSDITALTTGSLITYKRSGNATAYQEVYGYFSR